MMALRRELLVGKTVGDWLLNLPVLWMAVVVFAATYLFAAGIYWVVISLAVNDRARAFKAVSPGMLPTLGILFALLVGFIAVEVWNNYDKAKVAVATEVSALRAVVLLAGTFPEEQKTRIYALIDRHIEAAVNEEWPAMAQHRLTLSTLPTALIEALHDALTLKPADDSQRMAQSEMVKAIQTALDARRQRIVVSQSAVGTVKWAGILLQGLCTLIAIAMVHSDSRLSCAIAMTLFATGIALSLLLIAAYSRPFTGEISVGPDLLKQVIASEAMVGTSR
jgi:FtsH-binding integral membrane protein